ncbi:MAG: TetR/AcrR family transcriptional regulator [Actinomycetes bacterium]
MGTSSGRLPAAVRRQQLFDVAIGLFAIRGYRATTMDDIANAAGVTKPLLYQHFDSKRALYQEIVDAMAAQLLGAISSLSPAALSPREQVEEGFAGYFRVLARNANAFLLLYSRETPDDEELNLALEQVNVAMAVAVDPLINAGLSPDHRMMAAASIVGLAEGAGRHWLNSITGHEFSLEELDLQAAAVARHTAEIAWSGLRGVQPD